MDDIGGIEDTDELDDAEEGVTMEIGVGGNIVVGEVGE